MTNLTDKWRKGELEVGEEYWVILTNEWYLQKPVAPVRAFYSCDHEFEGYYDNDIKQVLASVPSYEKWIMTKNLSERAHLEMYKARGEKVRLEKENTKLKELLKTHKLLFELEKDNTKNVLQRGKYAYLINDIDQVLGEE